MTIEIEMPETMEPIATVPVDPSELINGDGSTEEEFAAVFGEAVESIGKDPEDIHCQGGDEPEDEPEEVTLTEEEHANYVMAWAKWEIECFDLEIAHSRNLEGLKEEQGLAAIAMKEAESEYKEAKRFHKDILAKWMELRDKGPTLPEEPKKEDFITKVEETIQEPVQRNEAEGSFADEPIDDSWRQIPTLEVIDGIDRMGEKKRDAIIHLYPTLGKLEDIRAEASRECVHFSDKLPKGCGKSIADAIEDRILETIAKLSKG